MNTGDMLFKVIHFRRENKKLLTINQKWKSQLRVHPVSCWNSDIDICHLHLIKKAYEMCQMKKLSGVNIN